MLPTSKRSHPEFPALPDPRNPVPFFKNADPCPLGSMAAAAAPAYGAGIHCRCRQSAPNRLRGYLGRAGCCSGPKQVAWRFSPEGDPTLKGEARRPPTLTFAVLGLLLLTSIYYSIPGEKARGWKDFFEKISGRGKNLPNPAPGWRPHRNLLAPVCPRLL